MALHGLLPIAEIQFADFIHPAFDQIVSEAARLRYRSNGDFGVPIVIRTPWGGGVHGALYHSQSIEAFYAHVPGLKVVMPSTPADAAGLLRGLDRTPTRPVPRAQEDVPRDQGRRARRPPHVPIGVADVKREGDDLTCVSYGYALHTCLDAAQRLAEEEGISVEVVDVRTLAPLDIETILASVRKTSKAIVVYEDNRTYGAGAEIASTIAEQALYDLDAPIVRVGGPDVPAMPFAAPLEHYFMEPEPDRIYARMLELAGPERVARRTGVVARLERMSPPRPRITTREATPPPADRRRDERARRDSLPARKPPWLKVRLVTGPNYEELKDIMRGRSLHTVCEEAMCPNIRECWEEREATFLILGSKCTRRCGFCDVMTAKPDPVDEDEPARIAEAVREMGLRYVVLTGVARDDLEDGGARIWASAIRAVRDAVPGSASRCCPRTSRAASATSRRCWTPSRTCSLTTWRPSGVSTAGSGRRSATTVRSRCSGSRRGTARARSPSRT